MSLNMVYESDDAVLVANALLLLLDQLDGLAQRCPLGSLVIASGDVLISLAQSWEATSFEIEDDVVYVVTVPAPVSTAKNHGVVFNHSLRTKSSAEAAVLTCPVDLYLQKPSIESMRSAGVVLEDEIALIDTGLVIFTGAALQSLLDLRQSAFVNDHGKINEAAQNQYLRFELYTELLLACFTSSNMLHDFPDYAHAAGFKSEQSLSEVQKAGLEWMWSTFHQFQLHMVYFPRGEFLHLGTSREVFNLLTRDQATRTGSRTLWYPQCRVIGSQLISSSSTDPAAAVPEDAVGPSATSTFVNAVVVAEPASLPLESLVEHCALSEPAHRMDHCFLSHVMHPQLCAALPPVSKLILQEVPLRCNTLRELCPALAADAGATESASTFCLLSQGIDDDTKASLDAGTIGGVRWADFLRFLGAEAGDVWPAHVPAPERSLWNAQLFPVFVSSASTACPLRLITSSGALWPPAVADATPSPAVLVQLLSAMRLGHTSDDDDAFQHATDVWKRSKRLSLADLLRYGDAEAMFLWRELLATVVSQRVRVDGADGVALATAEFEHFRRTLAALRSIHATVSIAEAAAALLASWFAHRFAGDGRQTAASVADVVRAQWTPSDTGDDTLAQLAHCVERYLATLAAPSQAARGGEETFHDEDWRVVVRVHFLRSMAMTRPTLLAHALTTLLTTLMASSAVAPKAVPRLVLALAQAARTMPAPAADTSPFAWPPLQCADVVAASDAAAAIASAADEDLQRLRDAVVTHLRDVFAQQAQREETAATTAASDGRLSERLEDFAQRLVQRQIEISLHVFDALSASPPIAAAPSATRVVVARAPVRIDLAGGWSDTPPICYDQAGSVLNVAVTVDGQQPLRCVAAFSEAPGVTVECWHRTNVAFAEASSFAAFATEQCATWAQLSLVAHSDSPCALPKACILLLLLRVLHRHGAVEGSAVAAADVDPLERVLSRLVPAPYRGLRLLCLSNLPAGSGMGGSSILAGVILHAVATLCGLCTADAAASSWLSSLVLMVSQVEQLMTTGGGWQDQVGGLYPGVKLARSPASLPLTVAVQSVALAAEDAASTTAAAHWQRRFAERVCLVYTGQQRLAKDTLINALRKYALLCTSSDSGGGSDGAAPAAGSHDDLVQQLIANAEDGFAQLQSFFAATTTTPPMLTMPSTAVEQLEAVDAALDRLGHVLQRYWAHKIRMAPGSDPEHIRRVLQRLTSLVTGLSLCGAGAGGFGVLVLRRDVSQATLQATLDAIYAADVRSDGSERWTVHRVAVDTVGVDAVGYDDASLDLAVLLTA